MDDYASFEELNASETEGVDYTIRFHRRASPYAVIAIHGGGIEPGTVDIAAAVAGDDHTFYAFQGIKKSGNAVLHITSTCFDEPTGLAAVGDADTVLSIHGYHGRTDVVYVGGRSRELKSALLDSLRKADFNAVEGQIPGLRGIAPNNICNRCRSGKGAQLEISEGLRRELFNCQERNPGRQKTKRFHAFVAATRAAMGNAP